MPSGSLIFPGKLRGEDSFGMMCSPRELVLPNAPSSWYYRIGRPASRSALKPAKHWKG